MPEVNPQTIKPKTKPTLPPSAAAFFPNTETPAAFRDFAERSLSQAKDNYEKLKSAAEEATGLLEETYATATKGAADYGLKVSEIARANTNATFHYASRLFAAKSSPDLTWAAYFDQLYALDWYLACGCIENDNKAWEALFAARDPGTGRARRTRKSAKRDN